MATTAQPVIGTLSPSKPVPSRTWLVTRSALLDVLITVAAFATVFFTRAVVGPFDIPLAMYSVLAITVINLSALYTFGVYDRIWSRTSGHGMTVIVYAIGGATALLTAIDLRLNFRPIPVSVLIVGNMLAFVGYVGVRYRSRLISGLQWRLHALWFREAPARITRTLIIGAGSSGQDLALRMRHHQPNANYRIVGFVDDDPAKQGRYVEGYRVLGTRHEIADLVDAHNIDLVVLAIHNIDGPGFRAILELCEQTQAMIKVVPDLLAAVNGKSGVSLLRDVQTEDLLGRNAIARHEGIDLSPIERRVILVTGAAGSIGSELSCQIVTYDPVRVILLDNNESGLHDLLIDLRERHPSVEVLPALVDISQYEALRRVFTEYRPQVVFHAAAYKHVPMLEHSPQEAVRVNIRGTANLMRLAREFTVERFVFISTDKAVNPSSVMGASKRIGELMLHANAQEGSSTRFAAVRFGNVLGSRGSVVPTFTRQIQRGGPVTITHEDMTRYFMTIPEAANLIIHAACLTDGDDIYLLQMGHVVRIIELAERMVRMRGLRPYLDIDIVATGVRPGEKLHEELYTGEESLSATAHPGILRIKSWQPSFDRNTFWQLIDQTLAQPCDQLAIRQQIMHVIDASRERPRPNPRALPEPAGEAISA